MRYKSLALWVPVVLLGMVATVTAGVRVGAQHAAHKTHGTACKLQSLEIDLDGDGRPEQVKIVRADGDAWADVWQNGALRSSTRVGAWRDDAELDAADVNADGRVDLVRRWSTGTQHVAQVWLSNGLAFESGGTTGVVSDTCVAQR
jgi:hypothetical protein